MGRRVLTWALAAGFALSCGETSRRPRHTPSMSGDEAGGAPAMGDDGGTGGTHFADAAGAGTEPSSEGGAGLAVGAGGELAGAEPGGAEQGGAPPLDERYTIHVITVPAPPPPPGFTVDDQLFTGTGLLASSPDGSVIVGSAEWRYLRNGGIFTTGYQVYVWTAATGAQYQTGNAYSGCASDAGVAFAVTQGGALPTFLRWAGPDSFTTLEPDFAVPIQAYPYLFDCSPTGSTAIGSSYDTTDGNGNYTLLWRTGEDESKVVRLDEHGLPIGTAEQSFGSDAKLSGDGTVLVADAHLDTKAQIFRGTLTPGPVTLQAIPNPAGETVCGNSLVSHDGSVIVGACDVGESSVVGLRWTSESGTQKLDSPGFIPAAMTNDGLVVIGNAWADTLVWWTPTGQVLSEKGVYARGLSDDGSVAIVDLEYPSFHRVARFTPKGGAQPLGELPGDDASDLLAFSADGSVVVGRSFDSATPAAWRAVLWDSQGPRDLNAELEASGADLQGLVDLYPARVWSGDKIRVLGWGRVPSTFDYSRVFMAELPTR